MVGVSFVVPGNDFGICTNNTNVKVSWSNVGCYITEETKIIGGKNLIQKK